MREAFDPGLRAEHPLRELEVAHLEGEEKRRHLRPRRRMGDDPQGKARLAHRRPCSDDHEVRLLEAGKMVVELVESGGDPCDRSGRLVDLLEMVECLCESSRSVAVVSTSRRWATSKTIASARSKTESTSSGALYPSSAISPDTETRRRRSACSSTIRA